MDLKLLGWDEDFSRSLEEIGARDTVPGRVILEYGKFYLVAHEKGEILAEPKGKMKHRAAVRSELPVIGDWVAVSLDSAGSATVVAVLERRNWISRKVAGHHTAEQVMAANVDVAIIVTSMDLDFSLRRLERYLLLARDNSIDPIIVLNKEDLSSDPGSFAESAGELAPGVPVYALSAIDGQSARVLLKHIPVGRTAVLIGSSGVGKSTIINALLGEDRLRTGDVRETDSKGRHTTTNRELVVIPGAGMLIDNPGMREIQLWGEGVSVAEEFGDISEFALNCRFRDCRHGDEPGCAVKEAISAGTLPATRYEAFQRLQTEAETLKVRQDEARRKKSSGRTRLIRGRQGNTPGTKAPR